MGSTVRWDCLLKGAGLFMGIVSGFLLIGAALELYALQVPVQAGFAGVLLMLYLAFWLEASGITGLCLLLLWGLVRARTICQ